MLRRSRAQIAQMRQQQGLLRKLSSAVEQSPNAVIIADPDGTIEYVNPRFTELTGYTLEEITGQDPSGLKSGATPAAKYAGLPKVITTGGEWRGEFLNRKKNGELYWEAASVSSVKNREGRITHYVGVTEDITARKKAEEAARQSEARSETLLAALPDLVFRLNRAGVYLDTRGDLQRRLRSFDQPLDHVIGRSMYELIPLPVAALIHQKIQAALDSGEVQSAEYELETVSGQTYFEARLVPIGPDEVISVARDVTQRKLAEAERERLINDLDAFSHTVAHDLKNPLQGIVGYASLLVTDISQFSTADIVRYLQVITQYGERMSAIINELLLLATVRKQGDVTFGVVDMSAVIHNVLLRLDYLIRQQHAEITIKVTEWPAAWGYAPWLEEVWANYISNAIKYGGNPPCVELGTDRQDGQTRFWVRDNGDGIPLDKTNQLFSEFNRLEQTHLEGYGLGLSIVRRVIDRLGGEVGVESTPGQGSTFFFSLPSMVKPETHPHE